MSIFINKIMYTVGILIVGMLFFSAHTVAAQTQVQYYYPINVNSRTQNQYGTQSQQLQIQQLIQLIAQLQAQLSAQRAGRTITSITNNRFVGNSLIDITTKSVTDVENDEARLQGKIDFNSSNDAFLWFEWGDNINNLIEETPRIKREDDEAKTFAVTITDLNDNERYYFRAVGEDEDGRIDKGSIHNFTTNDKQRNSRNNDEPNADTNSTKAIRENSAELNGVIDMNDFNNGTVFFIYGRDKNQVRDIEDDYDTYDKIDEDGDNLQKTLVDSDLDTNRTYRLNVSRLDKDTKYYFNICVEFENDSSDDTITCGNIEDFKTDNNGRNSNRDNEPDVHINQADNITDTTVELSGDVNMNDFNNGTVFFIYGRDKNQVRDIEDDYDTYDKIDEDGDNLQKIRVDTDLDDDARYTGNLFGLDTNKEYYLNLCVAFEDDSGDDKIICGNQENFKTDRN